MLIECLSQIQVLSNDPIGKISFATGGEKDDYNVVTYVAKDKRDNRCMDLVTLFV